MLPPAVTTCAEMRLSQANQPQLSMQPADTRQTVVQLVERRPVDGDGIAISMSSRRALAQRACPRRHVLAMTQHRPGEQLPRR